MRGRLETLKLLILIALRNLFASRSRTLIVGGIICFGAALVVAGTSLLASINRGLKASLVESVTGDAQLYHSGSKDELAIFGGMSGSSDLEAFPDFSKLKQVVEKVPNVKRVIPMGINEAIGASYNFLDRALARLRDAAKQREGEGAAQYAAAKSHARSTIEHLRAERALAHQDLTDAIDAEEQADMARATSDEFWSTFDVEPFGALEFLENRIAPLSVDGDMLWIRYVGTDLTAYFDAFQRANLIKGKKVPAGQRGLLFSSLYYEEMQKMKNARRLDKLKEAVVDGGQRIAKEETLQRLVRENKAQVREILQQLDLLQAEELAAKLRGHLDSSERDLRELLVTFFDTSDENIAERHAFFYSAIAPLVRLYAVEIGEPMTIKAFSKSGYLNTVNVTLYGVVEFRGLEKSPTAGMLCLMDLISFRQLYGYMTAERLAEIQQMKRETGGAALAREEAEAALFGAGAPVVSEGRTTGFEVKVERQADGAGGGAEHLYTKRDIEEGVAINAAVFFDDPSLAPSTMAAIDAASKEAGLPVKVLDWKRSTGMVGQLIDLLWMVLSISIIVIFIIALAIINNSMLMATLQRVKEIGTLRAMGAQRSFVLNMVGFETVVIGLFFGSLGAALGAGLIMLFGKVGIPASNDTMAWVFSGPRLYPTVDAASLVTAFVVVLFVSVLSGLYPARVATRVSPVVAMSSEE